MIITDYLKSKKKEIRTAFLFLGVCVLLVLAIIWAYMKFIESPPYVDSDRYPIRGIDVSRHNGMMNLDAAAASGIEFIFIKASEGASFKDENFHINHAKAGHAGLKRGAYHFFRFDTDGFEQARNFLSAIEGRHLELGVAIDVEDHGNPSGIPTDSVISRLSDMMEYLILKGFRPMLYTNRTGYEKYLMTDYPGTPLWICHFSETPFDADWTFWQFDHHARVDGISTEVDLNVFIGSRKDWNIYLKEMDPDSQY